VAIPGTRSVEHLHESLATLRAAVPDDVLRAARVVLDATTVAGPHIVEGALPPHPALDDLESRRPRGPKT